jgi:hypothetical protein
MTYPEPLMKKILLLAAVSLAAALGGCVVVPAEPVVYAEPAPVVVHPGHRHYGHYHRHDGPRYRRWR